jgi:hypothetical protein
MPQRRHAEMLLFCASRHPIIAPEWPRYRERRTQPAVMWSHGATEGTAVRFESAEAGNAAQSRLEFASIQRGKAFMRRGRRCLL